MKTLEAQIQIIAVCLGAIILIIHLIKAKKNEHKKDENN